MPEPCSTAKRHPRAGPLASPRSERSEADGAGPACSAADAADWPAPHASPISGSPTPGKALRTRSLLAGLGLALLQVAGCALLQTTPARDEKPFDSTYRKYLLKAERGDAESQNAVGFMLYHGEGVPMDRPKARYWFEQAARGGSTKAARNLSALSQAASMPARQHAARPQAWARHRGEPMFVRFCGGCHGFNGIARYEHAPSFAFGERLEKPDTELMASLRNGHAEMPSWEDKLPPEDLVLILGAVRRLPDRYDAGVAASMNDTPDFYFVFGPMEARPRWTAE